MNILVLTDFSAASRKAFIFAQQLAITMKSSICQLHVISPRKVIGTKGKDKELIGKAEKEMARISNVYPNGFTKLEKIHLPITNLARIGKLEEIISEVSDTHAIDLVILGTRDKHNLFEYLLGSVSTIIIRLAKTPVIIVPEKSVISPIKNIAIAIEEENNFPLSPFMKTFSDHLKAKTEHVFVYPLPSDVSKNKEEVYNPTWFDEEVNPEAKITVVRDLFIARGLDYFIKHHEIDLIALEVPERKGLNKWLHRSVSKQMIYNSAIPLLIQAVFQPSAP